MPSIRVFFMTDSSLVYLFDVALPDPTVTLELWIMASPLNGYLGLAIVFDSPVISSQPPLDFSSCLSYLLPHSFPSCAFPHR